ncbi:GLIPR1-like protein 2 [Saccoglossus kowalevskii]
MAGDYNWDTELERSAKDFTTCDNIGNDSVIDLDRYDNFFGEVNPQQTGRNIVFGHDMSLEDLIGSWFKQWVAYNYNWQVCESQNERCEDFVQLVWSEATLVGCSANPSCVHDGVKGTFLVGYYDKGSTPFKPPFKLGQECSQCDSGYGFCEDGLCGTEAWFRS